MVWKATLVNNITVPDDTIVAVKVARSKFEFQALALHSGTKLKHYYTYHLSHRHIIQAGATFPVKRESSDEGV